MLDDIVVSYEYYYYSLLVLFGLLFFITYFSGRFLLPILISATKQKWSINTLIIGTGKNALKMAAEFEKMPAETTWLDSLP